MKSLSQECIFLGFKSTNHRPTNQLTTDHLRTDPSTTDHQPQRLAESMITFERLDNINIFILWNKNTAVKAYNYTSVHYQKILLVSIKHVRTSQLYLFFYLLCFNALFLPRYSKLLSTHGFCFSSECEYYIAS